MIVLRRLVEKGFDGKGKISWNTSKIREKDYKNAFPGNEL